MATIQEMLDYDTLMSGDLMRRGMAMGNEIPPGEGGSPYQPYKPKPSGPYSPPPGKKKGNEMMMVNKSREEAAEELDEEDTAGDPSEFPTKQDLDVASIRPDEVRAVLSSGMFIGPRNQVYGRNSEGVYTPQGKFDNRIHGNIVPENLFSQANQSMMIAKGKKKKKKGLTIYDEAARRDAFRDMANEPYDPDTGRMGGGFDIMNDLLDLDEV